MKSSNCAARKAAPSVGGLFTLDDVIALIDASVDRLPAVPYDMASSLGRVLAADVEADRDHPACDCSAIDGYAVAEKQSAGEFVLDGELQPGCQPPEALLRGVAIRIFTGSAVPVNSELVMLEDAQEVDGRVRFSQAPTAELIRRRGSAYRKGMTLLSSGRLLTPGSIALLAAAGQTQPLVIPQPKVVHVSTGREIIAADQALSPWQIRNTNAPLIRALSEVGGAILIGHAHVNEATDELVRCVVELPAFDVLLVSGGSSAGRYDNTAEALQQLGFEILVRKVNLRPGKPLVIARRGAQWAFGLPGNPLSHFVTYNLFVHRLLCRMAGRESLPFLCVPYAGPVSIAANERESLHPARLVRCREDAEATAERIEWSDSGDLSVLDRTTGFLRVPAGHALLPGEKVHFMRAIGSDALDFPST